MSISELLKGVLIGIASILPGVSGGTLAVSMGIYDRIIKAVTHIWKKPFESIKALLPYGIGAVAGIVGFAFSVEYLFTHYPLQTSMAFMGLILGGVPMIWGRIDWKLHRGTSVLTAGLVFALVTALTFLQPANEETVFLVPSFSIGLWMIVIGMISAATLIIPGISGSMLLMMMGVYQPLLGVINDFLRHVFSIQFSAIPEDCMILVPFGIGIVLGGFLCARLMEILLERFQDWTYSGILGLVLASPAAILAEIPAEAFHLPGLLGGGVLFLLALLVARFL